MQICIPVVENNGLRSRTSDHFGAAPFFMIVDSESQACRAVANRNQHHGHGACQPLAALRGEQVDGVVVKGIGRGALARLRGASIQVLLCDAPTVEGALAELGAGRLSLVTPDTACGGHAHGHGHHHQRGCHGVH